MIEAKIIADSMNPQGVRLTTMQITLHRFVLPEFNTHRMFSRNFTSSRAIPVAKVLEQVRNDPAMPVEWGKNRPGMQATELFESLEDITACELNWRMAARYAAAMAENLMELGIHKQIANRVLEPYQWTRGVVTATDWDNFFALRVHPDAQPEIRELAKCMQAVYETGTPKQLKEGEWHLPYVSEQEKTTHHYTNLLKFSSARCARVSYNKHDGDKPEPEADYKLHDQLTKSVPPHLSPVEHQAQCRDDNKYYANFRGWKQYRKYLEELQNV